MIYDIAVVGGGIVGLATIARIASAPPAPQGGQPRERSRLQPAPDGPQQRRHPLGHLLQAGLAQGASSASKGRKLAWEYCDEKGIPYKQRRQADRRDRRVASCRASTICGSAASRTASRDSSCSTRRRSRSANRTAAASRRSSRRSPASSIGAASREQLRRRRREHGRRHASLARESQASSAATACTAAASRPAGEVEARYVITCGGLYSRQARADDRRRSKIPRSCRSAATT